MATKDFLKCFFSQVFKFHFHSRVLILIVHVCCYYTQPIFKDILSESNIPEKKLLSSQSDVYLCFKIVFKGLEKNLTVYSFREQVPNNASGATGESVFY